MIKSLIWGFLCIFAMRGTLFAQGVTRSIESVPGGCAVTVAWELAGKVESDLIVEERFDAGWAVDDTTVPFASLDASWINGNVARFAIKPSLLSKAGSITFTVKNTSASQSGKVAGDWKIYLGGQLRKGSVTGDALLTASVDTGVVDGPSAGDATSTVKTVEVAVPIKSFRMIGADKIELVYSSLAKAGTLVVNGCNGLGKEWKPVKRISVSAGDGSVILGTDEVGQCRFFKLKLETKE